MPNTHFGDFHVHCYLSRHGSGEIEEYVESAVNKGLAAIGFTEHIPVPGLDDPSGRMGIDEFEIYIRDIEQARKKYAADIDVLFALEADYLPRHHSFISEFIQRYPFDYIIGSVHFIDEWDFSNPLYKDQFEQYGVDRVFYDYFQLVEQAIQTGLYHTIGHLDLPKRYGHRPRFSVSSRVETILKELKKRNMTLDVNSSGLRKEAGEIYPSFDILCRAKTVGVPVVLGSDAHNPLHVAADFDNVRTLLKQAGYTTQSYFVQQKRYEVEL